MLKLPPAKLSDADARALFAMLDDDGSGELEIPELLRFLERGPAL